MTHPNSNDSSYAVVTQPSPISNFGLVLTVYILYLVGFVAAITALIGVIIAYLQREKADELCRSHFEFQIRTFWMGLLYLFIGALTIHFGVGLLVLIWWIVWTVLRCVKGLLALNAGESIRDPHTWGFG